MRSAERLQSDILEELAYDPKIDSSGAEDVVTLKGTLREYARKRAAAKKVDLDRCPHAASSLPRTGPFETHTERYEGWFDTHRAAYVAELLALRRFVPWEGRGLEIGVGTGRFAGPLGVPLGLDPSNAMLARAAARGVGVVNGVAEALPFSDGSLDHALVVTTICFVADAHRMIAEAHRVLRADGSLVIGFIDRASGLGQAYFEHREESVFYREAVFYSTAEVRDLLRAGGFRIRACGQTLFRPLAEITEIEPVRPGSGSGAFVVVAADRVSRSTDSGRLRKGEGGVRRRA